MWWWGCNFFVHLGPSLIPKGPGGIPGSNLDKYALTALFGQIVLLGKTLLENFIFWSNSNRKVQSDWMNSAQKLKAKLVMIFTTKTATQEWWQLPLNIGLILIIYILIISLVKKQNSFLKKWYIKEWSFHQSHVNTSLNLRSFWEVSLYGFLEDPFLISIYKYVYILKDIKKKYLNIRVERFELLFVEEGKEKADVWETKCYGKGKIM